MADIDAAAVLKMNNELRNSWLSDPNYTFDDFRRIFNTWLAQFPAPEGTRFTEETAGGVSAIWADAEGVDNTSVVVIHFHSGGYLLGSASGYRGFGGYLSQATGARVLLVDYRLAPEFGFPAAIDDAMAVYRWLLEKGVASNRIVICGDSAGGGLALITLQQIRDEGLPAPACGVAISPLADFTASGDSRTVNMPRDPLVTADLLESLAATYCGDNDRRDPRLSPLFGDWSNVVPLMILAGEIEALRDDGKLCAEAASAAGVESIYVEGEGMAHIWTLFADRLPQARDAMAQIGQFVRRHVGSR